MAVGGGGGLPWAVLSRTKKTTQRGAGVFSGNPSQPRKKKSLSSLCFHPVGKRGVRRLPGVLCKGESVGESVGEPGNVSPRL